jgi:hypothetical protein
MNRQCMKLVGSIAVLSLMGSNDFAQADVNGIPYNSDFPKAQYPYAQAPDGCSGPTHPHQVRDTWGPVSFNEACNRHDRCYYTANSTWQSCNQRFFSDLRSACERDLRIATRVPAPTLLEPGRTLKVYLPPEPTSLSTCYGLATTYYSGVQAGVVANYFNKAQDMQKRYNSWVAQFSPQPAASNYQSFRLQTGTALHETGDNFAFGVLPNGDLVTIKKSGTGSGKTEVHILSAASDYQSFRLQTGTALHETGVNFAFGVLPNGDLVAIKKSGTGSGKTEVHILAAQ